MSVIAQVELEYIEGTLVIFVVNNFYFVVRVTQFLEVTHFSVVIDDTVLRSHYFEIFATSFPSFCGSCGITRSRGEILYRKERLRTGCAIICCTFEHVANCGEFPGVHYR